MRLRRLTTAWARAAADAASSSGCSGRSRSRADGEPLALGGPRQRALLALLLLHANEVVPRERLIDGLWGDEPPGTAANALQVAVHGLRKALGRERIETRGAGYRAPRRAGRARPRPLRAAASSARGRRAAAPRRRSCARRSRSGAGRALADLRDAPFARGGGARLEELRLAALERRIEADLALGRHARARRRARGAGRRRIRTASGLRGQLMLALYRAGRQAEALEAYRARAPDARRGARRSSRARSSRSSSGAILRQDPSLAAPHGALTRRGATNLPAPPTPLVGRRAASSPRSTALLRAGRRAAADADRPGGSGKTRLALAVADELLDELRGRRLSSSSSRRSTIPALVAPTIAARSASGERRHRAAARGAAGSSSRRADAAARAGQLRARRSTRRRVVAELLAGRARAQGAGHQPAALRLSGEHEYPVPPLPLPEPRAADARRRSRADEAVALFVERARAVRPDFALTRRTRAAVAEICRALDGLPLALELAAARAQAAVAARRCSPGSSSASPLLDRRAARPARRASRRCARRSTGATTCSTSDEQRLFAALAVFAGGCTLEAAEAVCDGRASTRSTSLVDKSLAAPAAAVGRERASRCSRRSASTRPSGSSERGEAESLRRAHAEYFLALAERPSPS